MQPVLFTIPGLDWELQAYGFFIGLALILGWVIALQLGQRDRLPVHLLGASYVFGAAAGLFAARGVFLLQHPDRFEGWISLVQLQADGLASFAGIVVGLSVTAVHAGRHRVPAMAWFDCLAPAFAVGVVLERSGAFLAGTGFGRYAAPGFPLAIQFPVGSPAHAWHRHHLDLLLAPGATASLPVHPVQLYAVALGVLGILLCVAVRRHRIFSGQVFLAFTVYWLIARTMIEEWFRADAAPGVLGPLSPGQLLAIVLVAALLGVYRARQLRARREPAALRQWEGGPWTPKENSNQAGT